MTNVVSIDFRRISELYDLLHHFDLQFVKHASYQMFHLFGSPLQHYWVDENQTFGVYLVYFKLASSCNRADFIHSIQDAKPKDLDIFTEDEMLLAEDEEQFRYQASRLRDFLLSLAEEFDYEIWLIENGVQLPYTR